MIPGGTKTNFQTPLNDLTGYEKIAANQRKYLLAGNAEFPEATEAAKIVFRRRLTVKTKSIIRPIASAKNFTSNIKAWGLSRSKFILCK